MMEPLAVYEQFYEPGSICFWQQIKLKKPTEDCQEYSLCILPLLKIPGIVNIMAEIEWPWQYSFPPFFTLQPHAETKEKQLGAWKSLILDYYRSTKQAVVDIREVHSSPLFNNTSINRKLPSEVILIILEELAKSGNASPLDKSKQRWLVYWHTFEEWGEIIYNWAQENGFTGSVCTLFELTQGENTTDQEFYGLDTEVLIRSLRTLEASKKAELIMFDDNQGVKFF